MLEIEVALIEVPFSFDIGILSFAIIVGGRAGKEGDGAIPTNVWICIP